MNNNNVWPDEYIERQINMYFPTIYETVIECVYHGYGEWLIRTDDNHTLVYDQHEQSIRRVVGKDEKLTKEDFCQEFGYRLRKILYRTGLTQIELSEKIGIDQAQISRYINGKSIPDFYIINKIAKALGCPIDDFRYTD